MTIDAVLSTPKILPWIAQRYALPLDHVEALWHQAMLMADLRYGRGNVGSDYWRECVQTFLRLATDEGTSPEGEQVQPSGPITAHHVLEAQDRVRRRTLSMVERMMRAGTSMWSPRRPRARRRPELHH
jgi:hypothetical protein